MYINQLTSFYLPPTGSPDLSVHRRVRRTEGTSLVVDVEVV